MYTVLTEAFKVVANLLGPTFSVYMVLDLESKLYYYGDTDSINIGCLNL